MIRSVSILLLLSLLASASLWAASDCPGGGKEPTPQSASTNDPSGSPSQLAAAGPEKEEKPSEQEDKRLKQLGSGSTEDANALLAELDKLDSDKKEEAINGLQDQVNAEKDPEKKAGLELALRDLVTKLGEAEAKKLAGDKSDLRARIDQERKAQLERATQGKHNPVADARLSALEGMMRKAISESAANARAEMEAANERAKGATAAGKIEKAAMARVDRAEAERTLAAAEKQLKEFDVARVQHHEQRYLEAERAAHAFTEKQADSGSLDPKPLVGYSRNNLAAKEGIALAQKEMSPQAKEEIDKRNKTALAEAKDREERAAAEVAKAKSALNTTWWWGKSAAEKRSENAQNSQLDAKAAVFQAELQAKGYQSEPKPAAAPKPPESKPLDVVPGVRAVNEYTDARHPIHKNGNQTLMAVPVPGGNYAPGIAAVSTNGGRSYQVTALPVGLSVDTKTGAISKGAAVETGGLKPVGAIRTAEGQYSVVYENQNKENQNKENQNKERVYGTPKGTVNQISAAGLITPRASNSGNVTVSTGQKPVDDSYITKTEGATTTLTSRLLASAAPGSGQAPKEQAVPVSGPAASPAPERPATPAATTTPSEPDPFDVPQALGLTGNVPTAIQSLLDKNGGKPVIISGNFSCPWCDRLASESGQPKQTVDAATLAELGRVLPPGEKLVFPMTVGGNGKVIPGYNPQAVAALRIGKKR